ncbi:MAG: phage tail tape measure protein [Bacteroidetes bacterium]|nr:phage tail tape measure protein [Bacteroidota bacterium]
MDLAELKYILTGEDHLSAKFKSITGASERSERALVNHTKSNNALKNSFSELAGEVPGLGRAFSLATNPYLLAGGAIAGIAYGLNQAATEAANFKTQFRQLENLNLDKTRAQIQSLKDQVLNTAYEGGFNPYKTSTAFFDVQSLTGKYGSEVARIVAKQGEFANVMQADFNEFISGSAKAMANYGFGAEELDGFNRSMYATVNIAKTTYEELSKVSAMYAGSSASAKQTYDTANKLFGVFTLKTKSVDEAATLTKVFFNDLTKATTIKSFKSVGVDVFDANKHFKQADTLMLELQKKFKGLDDKQIISLKNKFQGSEGLIAFVQAATDKTTKLKDTFESFDSAKFKMGDALEIAKQDINYINDQLENRMLTAQIRLGENLLPLKAKWTEIKMDVVDLTNQLIMGIDKWQDWQTQTSFNKKYGGLENNLKYMKSEEFYAEINKMKAESDSLSSKAANTPSNSVTDFVRLTGFLKTGKWAPDFKTIYTKDANFLSDQIDNLIEKYNSETNGGKKITEKPLTAEEIIKRNSQDPHFKSGFDGISGGGSQVRNITVNITKLIEKQIIQSSNLTEAAGTIQAQVEEALIRAISGAEQVLAN